MNKILQNISNKIKNYLNECGSFTLETTLVFPLIFIFTLLLITLFLIQFQLAGQFYATSTMADRTAHNWEVIDRVLATGEYTLDAKRSNLYWRLADENIFQGIIMAREVEGKEALLRAADEVSNRGFANPIINQASDLLAENYSSVVKLDTRFFKNIKIKTIGKSANLLPRGIVEEMNITVSSYSFVSEPAEFIRLINVLKGQIDYEE